MERFILRVGDFNTTVFGELYEAPSTSPKAVTFAQREEIEAKPFDWSDDAWLYDLEDGSAGELRMTARVLRVAPHGGDVIIGLVSPFEFITTDELMSAHFFELSFADAMWAILGPTGFPRESLAVHGHLGLDELPLERFQVVVPGIGFTTSSEFALPDETLIAATDPLAYEPAGSPSEVESAYLDANCWVSAMVEAPSVYDAEVVGAHKIDWAVSQVALATSYSFRSTPRGGVAVRPFERAWTRATPALLPIVHVRSRDSARGYLRSRESIEPRPIVDLSETPDLGNLIGAPESTSIAVREAFAHWYRGRDERDTLSANALLWTALEFYAAGAPQTKLFDRNTRRRLADAVSDLGLSGEQHSRVIDWMAGLNQRSLLDRITTAITADGAPLSSREAELLDQLRKLRNDAAHGRPSRGPTSDEIRRGYGILARLLAFRVARIRDETQASGDSHAPSG